MPIQPPSGPGEDAANPYAAPTAEPGDRRASNSPEALALRFAHRRDESYVKALAIINIAYVLLFGLNASHSIWILLSHLAGRVSAPWIMQPGGFAGLVLQSWMPIAALGAACGFLRRKRWALRFEWSLAACWFSAWALEPFIRSGPMPHLEYIGNAVLLLAFTVPMLNSWDLPSSMVFEPEYADAVAATRRIWAPPKLPLELILIAFAFFVVGVVLIALSSSS